MELGGKESRSIKKIKMINNNKILLYTVTFFGTGLLSKKMPGTIGSLFASIFSYLLPKYSIIFYTIAVILFIIGTITSQKYVITYPKNKDPGFIVIDEACAIFLSNAILLDIFEYNYTLFLLSFLFFRLFDILKPFPIRKIETYCKNNEVLNGFGIMIDDIMAVIPTILTIIIIVYLLQNYMIYGFN